MIEVKSGRSRYLVVAAVAFAGLSSGLPETASAQAVSALEQQCYDAVQGKVAWNTSGSPGSRQWAEGNARSLCKGTTNPAATIACFQAEIGKGVPWDRATSNCARAGSAPAPANAPAPAPAPAAAPAAAARPGPAPAAVAADSSRPCEEKDFVRDSDKVLGDVCYKETATRGAGKIPTTCAAGMENHGGLCYARCRAGYTGAVTMCVPECPPGFRNDGLHCAKGAPYGRGAGYAWQFGDALNDSGMIKRCEADNGAGNCEKNGLIFYPKCKAGYVAVGANVCSPQCPSGMVDIGVSCQKVTYDRGVGTIPNVCPAGQVNDAGLCYPTCAGGQTGIGPVCWADACPANFPVKCGAMCARNQDQCAKVTTTMVTSPFKAVASIVGMALSGGASGAVTPVVENAEREAYRQLRIQSISKVLKQRVANERKCTLSDAAALMAATGLEQLERYQSSTDIMARADPSGVSTVIDAYAKPICGR
ncbi:MAG: hypothetical protein HZC37_00720 [Burkholderiales bacterium]|nr:hypothetical protein [Burkholderiales bacterium]